MNPPRTTIVSLAPWTVLALLALLAVIAKYVNADAMVYTLLSTIAGICGGAILPRRNDAPTTTVTAGDPPTVTTAPS